MPVELRKRKAVEPAPAPPAKKKNSIIKAAAKVKDVVTGGSKPSKANGTSSTTKVAAGDTISLETFGGEIETNDGTKTTLEKLVDESRAGVVLFTYPKASTPGCTTQACLFRDSYEPLTATGFSIFGLSKDSPKANTTFKEKQKLPYPLLCDPSAGLISAIGMKKAPNGTTRGVFVIDKTGKVLAAEPGGPAATVEVVKKLVAGSSTSAPVAENVGSVAESEKVMGEAKTRKAVPATNGVNGTNGASKEDIAKADVAAQVANTAELLDSNKAKPAGL